MRVDLGVGEIGPVGPVGPEGPQGPPGLGFDVVAKTTSYTVVPGDSGNLLTFNGANKTATLPAAAPAEPWAISILNLNATALTVTPNGLTLNGSGASITLQQGQGVFIWSDGSNYLVGGALPTSVVNASSGGGVSAWAPSTVYAVNQLVSNGGVTYICLVAHTSGGSFSGVGTNWAVFAGSTAFLLIPPTASRTPACGRGLTRWDDLQRFRSPTRTPPPGSHCSCSSGSARCSPPYASLRTRAESGSSP